jgi:hypothetical protein
LLTNLKFPGSTCNVTSGNCSAAGDLDCALADPQVRHRDRRWNLTDGDGDSIKVDGTPLKFAGLSSCQHAYRIDLVPALRIFFASFWECLRMRSRASPKKALLVRDEMKRS